MRNSYCFEADDPLWGAADWGGGFEFACSSRAL